MKRAKTPKIGPRETRLREMRAARAEGKGRSKARGRAKPRAAK